MIEANKAELMSSLHELSAEERYSQILELGQLLSNELYIERMKARGYEIDKVDVADQKDRPQETVEKIPIVEEQTRMAQEQERPATPIMSIVDESVKDLEEKAEEPPVKEEQNDISAI